MKRLTKKVDGAWTAICEYGNLSYPVVTQDVIDRLAAYEDTGLEPEDIKQVCTEEAILKLAGQLLGITPDRLRELAEADREGRCVVLPITVPGWGWTCRDGFPTAISAYYPFPSSVLRSMESGYVFGKTKDEAEAALAKLNSGT